MMYRFSIQHCPGRWHRGSDAMSRNVANAANTILEVLAVQPTADDEEISLDIESSMKIASMEAINDYGDTVGIISTDMIRASGRGDAAYTLLIGQIGNGFPKSRREVDPLIRGFWEVRHRLSVDNGIVLLDRRIVIPVGYRKRVLRCLHSAHQGVVGMKARANETVYWPGMDACIRNHRESCGTCNRIGPSLPREPLILSESPDWPFQKIVMDLFFVEQHAYIAFADRFTGWLMLYHLPPGQATSARLIDICRNLFQTYGVPEEMSRDGGPPMHSHQFKNFLSIWKVNHRVSSVSYAQSNGRAELAVKAAKRIVYDNVATDGSLNTDKVARAILQYRNTPIQGIGLSPAQLLLHRHLRDCLPSHPSLYRPHKEWVTAGYQREAMLGKRNAKLHIEYNRRTHVLPQLKIGDHVLLQDQASKKWNRTGTIVEMMPHRQYNIRMDGSGRVTMRNRRFIKPSQMGSCPVPIVSPTLNPEATPFPTPLTQIITNQPNMNMNKNPPLTPDVSHEPNRSMDRAPNIHQPNVTCIPRALARLGNFNNPGNKEIDLPTRSTRNSQK